jgi:hypothetical protein
VTVQAGDLLSPHRGRPNQANSYARAVGPRAKASERILPVFYTVLIAAHSREAWHASREEGYHIPERLLKKASADTGAFLLAT